jgi:hypothetical protein
MTFYGSTGTTAGLIAPEQHLEGDCRERRVDV